MPITVSGTTITFNDSTTQTTAGKTGTVTSVATGNGLSGGTITTTGTLTVACPTFNSVGSYCFIGAESDTFTSGTNYAAGAGGSQMKSQAEVGSGHVSTNNLSGTWKWMGSIANGSCAVTCRVVGCRVS